MHAPQLTHHPSSRRRLSKICKYSDLATGYQTDIPSLPLPFSLPLSVSRQLLPASKMSILLRSKLLYTFSFSFVAVVVVVFGHGRVVSAEKQSLGELQRRRQRRRRRRRLAIIFIIILRFKRSDINVSRFTSSHILQATSRWPQPQPSCRLACLLVPYR